MCFFFKKKIEIEDMKVNFKKKDRWKEIKIDHESSIVFIFPSMIKKKKKNKTKD